MPQARTPTKARAEAANSHGYWRECALELGGRGGDGAGALAWTGWPWKTGLVRNAAISASMLTPRLAATRRAWATINTGSGSERASPCSRAASCSVPMHRRLACWSRLRPLHSRARFRQRPRSRSSGQESGPTAQRGHAREAWARWAGWAHYVPIAQQRHQIQVPNSRPTHPVAESSADTGPIARQPRPSEGSRTLLEDNAMGSLVSLRLPGRTEQSQKHAPGWLRPRQRPRTL